MRKTWALFGDPVEHSLSPLFQNAALKAAGVDGSYEAIRCVGFELMTQIDRVRKRDLLGANVTIPHKLRALALCDIVTGEAKQVGAVNWIGLAADGRLLGDNTDARGLAAALAEAGVSIPGGVGVVLGAGGAARAGIVALRRAGARRIVVGARRPEEAVALARAIGSPVVEGVPLAAAREEARTADIVVSAVPASAWPDVAPDSMREGAWVCDLAYAKEGTPAEAWAKSKKLRSLGGLPMLLHQGALSFEQWLPGVPFPMEAARKALGL